MELFRLIVILTELSTSMNFHTRDKNSQNIFKKKINF